MMLEGKCAQASLKSKKNTMKKIKEIDAIEAHEPKKVYVESALLQG